MSGIKKMKVKEAVALLREGESRENRVQGIGMRKV